MQEVHLQFAERGLEDGGQVALVFVVVVGGHDVAVGVGVLAHGEVPRGGVVDADGREHRGGDGGDAVVVVAVALVGHGVVVVGRHHLVLVVRHKGGSELSNREINVQIYLINKLIIL